MKTVYIEKMSWAEFQEMMKEEDTLIIPLGVMEEHGPHNPLACDTWIGEYCAGLLAERTRTPVAPILPYGFAHNVQKFPGSTSVEPELYREVLYAYCASFIRWGVKRILFINGHGGNTPVLDWVCQDLYRDFGTLCFYNDWWTIIPQIAPEYDCQDHGGYYETSMLMAARPDLPRMELAKEAGECRISPGIHKFYVWTFENASIGINCDVTKFNPYGNVGNAPFGASKELGDKLTELYVNYNVDLLAEIKKIPIPFPAASPMVPEEKA